MKWKLRRREGAGPPENTSLRHTDLHIVEGDLELPRLPAIPGHQGVGVVESKINGAGVMIISED